MKREKWYDMYNIKKRIDDLNKAKEAGLYYDEGEVRALLMRRDKLWDESLWERSQMDETTEFCYKARFYDGMSYRQIMLLVFEGLKGESSVRKRISRWRKKWEKEGVEREEYEKAFRRTDI